jgi:oligoribonuclease NrnB/cAMP/cGMP phosphodiesterase (DHH superfamily)
MERLDKTFAPDATEVVLFHKGCTDGFAAAWVAHLRLKGKPNVFYHAVAHGDEPPWEHLRGKNVAIVDFSWPRDVTLQIKEEAKGFVLLDHHKTSKNNIGDVVGCTIYMEDSGATLAWCYFAMSGSSWLRELKRPRVLAYVKDRDLWRWQEPHSREFNAALFVEVPNDFDEWNGRFLGPSTDQIERNMIKAGRHYLVLLKKLADGVAKWALERVWRGLRCRVAQVNPRSLASEVGESILRQHSDARVALCWTYDDWKKCYNVSVRTREGETDATLIAEQFGGGGHPAAAAFKIDLKGRNIEALFEM